MATDIAVGESVLDNRKLRGVPVELVLTRQEFASVLNPSSSPAAQRIHQAWCEANRARRGLSVFVASGYEAPSGSSR